MRKSTPREARAERLLRRIRSHPALWGDMGDAKERQAERILTACKGRLRIFWSERAEESAHRAGQRKLYTWA